MIAGGIDDVVAHRVATAVGQEYEGGVVGAVAGQTVKGVVALHPLGDVDGAFIAFWPDKCMLLRRWL